MNLDKPASLSNTHDDYPAWLSDLKTRIHNAQQRAALAENRELVLQIITEVNYASE